MTVFVYYIPRLAILDVCLSSLNCSNLNLESYLHSTPPPHTPVHDLPSLQIILCVTSEFNMYLESRFSYSSPYWRLKV